MRNSRGQASILVAIIFQALFLLFAMVINVGLLVHDKINLQNSADIAAYYGAMKQAEVLNAMAHVNYQIRQAYKLLMWRYWSLGSAGNNTAYEHGVVAGNGELDTEWAASDGPLICINHKMWYETIKRGGHSPQNLCHNRRVPRILPVKLSPIQSLPIYSFMQIFAAQSQINSTVFDTDFKNTGPFNYYFALRLLASYKLSVANRRLAMQQLEKLLVEPPSPSQGDDFLDLQGQSVKATALKTFVKNLTLANENADFSFHNGVYHQPFLVPRELHLFLRYADFHEGGDSHTMTIRDLSDPPEDKSKLPTDSEELADLFVMPDYSSVTSPTTPDNFIHEDEGDPRNVFRSLALFEKNPWIVAYVGVRAVSHPKKMLFSPFLPGTTVELVAESYAMPFGGRVGPWMNSEWQPNQGFSTGDKIDPLLPAGLEEAFGGSAVQPPFPNYSRFPGDSKGMNARSATNMGLGFLAGMEASQQWVSVEGDYNLSLRASEPWRDPLANRPEGSPARAAELLAISPDFFDAAYYSIDPYFSHEPAAHPGHRSLERRMIAQLCQQGCYDFGSVANQTGASAPLNIADDNGPLKLAREAKDLQWKITDPQNLYTGWTQEKASDYSVAPASIGRAPNLGGRTGYSVKIVSRESFFKELPLGGGASGKTVTGHILNGPQ